MIEYHAPAGVAYEPIVTDDPVAFLDRAKETAKAGAFKAEDFGLVVSLLFRHHPGQYGFCINRIHVVDTEESALGLEKLPVQDFGLRKAAFSRARWCFAPFSGCRRARR